MSYSTFISKRMAAYHCRLCKLSERLGLGRLSRANRGFVCRNGNNVTLDVSSGYLSLSRLHYNEEGKPELGEKAQELIEFETGIDISLSAEEVASMTVLEFMTKLAKAKGGAK